MPTKKEPYEVPEPSLRAAPKFTLDVALGRVPQAPAPMRVLARVVPIALVLLVVNVVTCGALEGR